MLDGIAAVQRARYGLHQLEMLAFRLFGLTETEQRVGSMLLQGYTYEDVAARIHVSVSTVKGLARSIFAKVDVKDRTAFERHMHQLIERV